MKLHLFIPLCLTIVLLAFNGRCQNNTYGEMDFTTIIKQSGTVTQISLIAPAEFNGVSVDYSIRDTSGTVTFSSNGANATTSFTLLPLYSHLKGKTLHFEFDNKLPNLVIPMVYIEGVINVIGRGELITHTSSISKMGVWNCRTSIRKDSEITKNLAEIPDGIIGRGSVVLVPFDEPQNNSDNANLQDYYETFLPAETTIRKISRERNYGNHMGEFHGRAAQISHILSQQGVEALVEKNLKPGFYRWYAADLSETYLWAPAEEIPFNNPSMKDLFAYVTREILRYDSLYNSALSVFPVALYDVDLCNDFMKQWSSVRYFLKENGDIAPMHLPKMKVLDLHDAIKEMKANIDIPVSLMGEYHCMDKNVLDSQFYENLKFAGTASQKLLVTERLTTILSLLKGGFTTYPEEDLEKAWNLILEPALNNHEQLNKSISISDSILDFTLNQFTPLISTQGLGKPVVVINPGTHPTSDMIAFPTNIALHEPTSIEGAMRPDSTLKWRVFDGNGEETPAQMINRNGDQYLLFSALKVPGSGFKTYYLKAANDNQEQFTHANVEINDSHVSIENDYYKISLSEYSLSSIFDKKKRAEIIKEGSTFGSYIIRNIISDEIVYQSDDDLSSWKMEFDGPVLSEFKKVDKTPVGNVITTLTVFHQVKKIGLDFCLDENLSREDCIIETPFVADMIAPTVKYKVPLGFSKDGYAVVEDDIFYTNKEDRFSNVKNVNGMVSVSNGSIGVCISGDFLLCDISELNDRYMRISPMSVAGANGGSVISMQITSSYSEDKQLFIDGYAFNKPFIAVPAPEKNMGMIPDQISFFELRNRELEILSLRKNTGSQDVLIRILETKGMKSFAILDPVFSFSGFSLSDMNGGNPTLIPTKQAARLKLKTAIDPWSTSTILLNR